MVNATIKEIAFDPDRAYGQYLWLDDESERPAKTALLQQTLDNFMPKEYHSKLQWINHQDGEIIDPLDPEHPRKGTVGWKYIPKTPYQPRLEGVTPSAGMVHEL